MDDQHAPADRSRPRWQFNLRWIFAMTTAAAVVCIMDLRQGHGTVWVMISMAAFIGSQFLAIYLHGKYQRGLARREAEGPASRTRRRH